MRKKILLFGTIYLPLAVAFIVLCIHLIFIFYFDLKIRKELQQEVDAQSQGEYELKIEGLRTNIFNQSIFISGFLLHPDKSISANSPKYFASADEINLVDFRLFQFLFKKNLIVKRLEVVNPSGNIFKGSGNGHSNSAEANSGKKFSIYNLLSKHINFLIIERIEIENADIKVYDVAGDSFPVISSKDNELRIINFKINREAELAGRYFLADKAELKIKKFTYITKDSLYSVRANNLTASYTDSTLVLDSILLIPNFSKKKFAGEAGTQTDRMRISASLVEFKKMNVKLFFERNWFLAEQLKINSLIISAYRDKNDWREFTKPKSVQQLVKNIPFYTRIGSIQIADGTVTYEEVAEGSDKPGKLLFTDLNVKIAGFTNDTSVINKKPVLDVSATGTLMNNGTLRAQYLFPLNTDELVFDCSGSLTSMDMTSINPILEPNARVSIKKGTIDSMIFSFHATDRAAKGTMKLIYHNLKIELINKEKKESGAFKDAISFLAHRLFIKEQNPSKNKAIRITEINYERDPSRFIFNYTWKSVLSGIKPAVGIPDIKNEKR